MSYSDLPSTDYVEEKGACALLRCPCRRRAAAVSPGADSAASPPRRLSCVAKQVLSCFKFLRIS